MARPENAQIEEEAAEKVVPIADPEADTVGLPGAVTKRPFVLDKTRGSGGGNMPLMLMVLGAIIIFGIGMLAFLSSKGTTKKKTAAEATKPNLGRVTGTTAPGDLIPSDKVNRPHYFRRHRAVVPMIRWPGERVPFSLKGSSKQLLLGSIHRIKTMELLLRIGA